MPFFPYSQVLAGCQMALLLDADRADILTLVQGKMGRIAPNLSIVVGTAIAAQLMGLAGGLNTLSQMPACNIQVCDNSHNIEASIYVVKSRGGASSSNLAVVLGTATAAQLMGVSLVG